MSVPLPVDSVLPDLLAALGEAGRALLIAPPGAGKTTRVAPALLGEHWCSGQVLLLVPRRLAARAAAEYMSSERGEPAGATIGYQTRLDSKTGPGTRIIAMTHGVFLSRIQADPELPGVSAVLFDEVHERSLDSDLALALALDAAAAFRPDLRLVAMSATLDGDRFGRLLGDPRRIESHGKAHPLDVIHAGRDAAERIEPQMAAAIRRALDDHPGSLLAFLPGVAEIERTADALGTLGPDFVLHRLHGGIDPTAQRLALAKPPVGKRKVVLATSIAETSVTLEDVRIVVDSGLARRPRYDRGAGLTRLTTKRASRAAVAQRAGRAARQAPGVAIRLWEEAATVSLPAHDPPEILEADLSSLLLACLLWGEPDPAKLPFLDPPPAAGIAEARQRLSRLGALDADGRVTPHGRRIAGLPLEPRLAHMLVQSAGHGLAMEAAAVAVLLTERGLGGTDPDIEARFRRWQSDRSRRAKAALNLAEHWRRLVAGSSTAPDPQQLGKALALAFPDRIARARDRSGETWQSVSGRAFRLDGASPLARSPWLAIGEVAGRASGARILSAAAIDEQDVLVLFANAIEVRHEADFDPAIGAVVPVRTRSLGVVRLSTGPDPEPDQEAIASSLVEGVRAHGLGLLPWPAETQRLRARAAFARLHDPAIPAVDDQALLGRLDEWLPMLVRGVRRLDAVSPAGLRGAVDGMLGWDGSRQVDRLAPDSFETPAGSRHFIDYAAAGGPTVDVRAQALFGLSSNPTVAGGRVPLTLAITSPAGRPIQTSRDLPGFWAGSWREVAKEMRGRYPRHSWPDDPANAPATFKTKRASQRGDG